MNSDERRTRSRCPSCQGPAVEDSTFPEGLRCRNSTCKHNHSKATCPRCSSVGMSEASFSDGKWHYTCSECFKKWDKN